jgi:hypothetical protein
VLACPFCSAPETDRLDLEGSRFIVFRCQFTPQVDPTQTDGEIERHLLATYGPDGPAYFRSVCDRLHLFVVRGDGARRLTAPSDAGAPT